jgi:adenosylmethionine-8-amino-7-oxononanoate aminotransferase
LVRRYWSGRKATKFKIISRYEGYHGNTAAAMTASGMDMAGMPGVPGLIAGYVHIEPPYQFRRGRDMDAAAFGEMCANELVQAIEREGADSVAAFVAEPIVGVGGYIAPPDNYWKLIREVCDKYDVLLVLDEVMTGFCRTGNMFASQTFNVEPDAMVLGKGITSNYVPCGAVVFNDKIFEEVEGDYLTGFTNSGHPRAMAACLAALDAYESENICENVDTISGRILSNLQTAAEQLDYIGEVSGKGLMIGVDLMKDRDSVKAVSGDICQRIVSSALENGLLLRARGSRLSISPPLNISAEEADILCTRLLEATACVCDP